MPRGLHSQMHGILQHNRLGLSPHDTKRRKTFTVLAQPSRDVVVKFVLPSGASKKWSARDPILFFRRKISLCDRQHGTISVHYGSQGVTQGSIILPNRLSVKHPYLMHRGCTAMAGGNRGRLFRSSIKRAASNERQRRARDLPLPCRPPGPSERWCRPCSANTEVHAMHSGGTFRRPGGRPTPPLLATCACCTGSCRDDIGGGYVLAV